jgi:hypothetical protein
MQRKRRRSKHQRFGLGAGGVDNRLQQLHLLIHAVTNPGDGALRIGVVCIELALEHVRPAMDGVQRTTQVMRHERQHVVAHEQGGLRAQTCGAFGYGEAGRNRLRAGGPGGRRCHDRALSGGA